MNETYKKQVALLVRIMPLIYKIKDFAIHGGTAINLFVKDMPRYSVDIDLTYLPIKNREESILDINNYLSTLKQLIEKAIPGIRIIHTSQINYKDVYKITHKEKSYINRYTIKNAACYYHTAF